MTSFALKMIAIVSMFLDHIGYFIYKGYLSTFNYLGRLAFPIFAYQISEGYTHTKNLQKYFIRLFIFALVSQIPFTLFLYGVHYQIPVTQMLSHLDLFELNIFFTLFMGLFCILLYDKSKSKILALISIGIVCYAGELLKVDYGYWGILLIFLFYLFKENKVLTTLVFFTMCFLKYFIQPIILNEFNMNLNYFNNYAVFLFIGTFLAIIPILLYNGKLGFKTKRLLYIFYPLHLLLIYLATLF